jgi:hypothetical protein
VVAGVRTVTTHVNKRAASKVARLFILVSLKPAAYLTILENTPSCPKARYLMAKLFYLLQSNLMHSFLEELYVGMYQQ